MQKGGHRRMSRKICQSATNYGKIFHKDCSVRPIMAARFMINFCTTSGVLHSEKRAGFQIAHASQTVRIINHLSAKARLTFEKMRAWYAQPSKRCRACKQSVLHFYCAEALARSLSIFIYFIDLGS